MKGEPDAGQPDAAEPNAGEPDAGTPRAAHSHQQRVYLRNEEQAASRAVCRAVVGRTGPMAPTFRDRHSVGGRPAGAAVPGLAVVLAA